MALRLVKAPALRHQFFRQAQLRVSRRPEAPAQMAGARLLAMGPGRAVGPPPPPGRAPPPPPAPPPPARSLTTARAAADAVAPEASIAGVRAAAAALAARVAHCLEMMDVAALEEGAAALEAQSSSPDIWDDPDRARKVLQRAANLKADLATARGIAAAWADVGAALELAEMSGDEAERLELLAEAGELCGDLSRELDAVELQKMLSGRFDQAPARVTITAGAGGADACDWAEMLERMYLQVRGTRASLPAAAAAARAPPPPGRRPPTAPRTWAPPPPARSGASGGGSR